MKLSYAIFVKNLSIGELMQCDNKFYDILSLGNHTFSIKRKVKNEINIKRAREIIEQVTGLTGDSVCFLNFRDNQEDYDLMIYKYDTISKLSKDSDVEWRK